eukprot:CAMPEP_0202895450 /NCGR_PEP_ID=MMETSP1392-20130828/4647_1 /ASSEMBLY_ACC=CAM_ASM_000868 /TAXON_ID=225041 /ORGANISM="Chlamydomonas chlamydogama, Strain SAG 11-48b" /LENGTH=182 /DNA_ID=CAMNT_0049580465 /DNA_START=550 /DNA_END=1100 /DNA_ORIENTATION=+
MSSRGLEAVMGSCAAAASSLAQDTEDSSRPMRVTLLGTPAVYGAAPPPPPPRLSSSASRHSWHQGCRTAAGWWSESLIQVAHSAEEVAEEAVPVLDAQLRSGHPHHVVVVQSHPELSVDSGPDQLCIVEAPHVQAVEDSLVEGVLPACLPVVRIKVGRGQLENLRVHIIRPPVNLIGNEEGG